MSDVKAISMRTNKSLTYVFPMIVDVTSDIMTNLIGVYIGDKDYPEFNNHIFLQYKFNGTEFLKLEEKLKNSNLFVKTYDPDKYTVMFVFHVPEKWQKDYNRFLKSKYSTFSDLYKQTIITTFKLTPNSPLCGVLFKQEKVYLALEERLGCNVSRELEASSVWNSDYEIFNESMKIRDAIEEKKLNYI